MLMISQILQIYGLEFILFSDDTTILSSHPSIENQINTKKNWKKWVIGLRGHNWVIFFHRLQLLNSNFGILKTWNCFQLE